MVVPDLATAFQPSATNGCSKPCWAAAHLVTATSKSRITPTASKIEPDQLASIRRQITVAIGLEP